MYEQKIRKLLLENPNLDSEKISKAQNTLDLIN